MVIQGRLQLMYSPEKDNNSKIESIVNFKELYYQERQRRIELEKQLQLEKIKVKRLMSNHTKSKTRYCAQCSANISSKKELPKDDGQLISQLKDFSEKMESMKFPTLRKEMTEPSIMSKIEEGEPNRKKHVGMIENLTIFGIKEELIENYLLDNKSTRQFEGEILYSKKQKNQSEYLASKLVFPSGMTVKKCIGLKAKQKTIELMSYCYTNLKCFILNLQCPDSYFDEHFHDNDLLRHINPDHRLFCICIGIHDYTCIHDKTDKINISLGHIQESNGSFPSEEEPKIKSQGHENSFANKASNRSIEEAMDNMGDLEIGITQRVFCIMTYYPFFTFFQQILRNLINIVKTERLTIYNHNDQNMKLTIRQTDSRFQTQRMVTLLEDCFRDLEFKKLNFNKEYELRLLNQTKITLLTNYDQAKNFFIRQWIYSVVSMFTFQDFIDLFTLVMLEDRIVFICENSHILTHTIYLFSHVLVKPLNYPFPIVNIIPGLDEDYLNAPFPVVYGLLKKRKALESTNIVGQYDNTYVFLNPERAEVSSRPDRKLILNNKPSKLLNNKELKELFRDLKKSRKKESKSMKYELESTDYCILANAEEKQKGIRIVNIIKQFMHEEVTKELPNKFELQNEKKKMDAKELKQQKDEHGYLLSVVIEKFKKKTKDPFILQLLNTQIVNNYLFT